MGLYYHQDNSVIIQIQIKEWFLCTINRIREIFGLRDHNMIPYPIGVNFKWWADPDSNWGPSPCQGDVIAGLDHRPKASLNIRLNKLV